MPDLIHPKLFIRRIFDILDARLEPVYAAYPLADRELTRVASDKRTFIVRVAITGIFLVLILANGLDALTSQAAVRAFGTAVVGLVAIAHIALALGVAPFMSAGLIAEEKRDRTLSLLLMADFRGWDIFLAKFLSVFLSCGLLILSTSPLLAIASLTGGVELRGIIALVIVSLALAAHSCAVGLWASTRSAGPREAMLLTVAILGLWHVALFNAPVALGVADALELSPLRNAIDFVSTGAAPSDWAITAAFHGIVALLFALRTVRVLPSIALDDGKGVQRRARQIPSTATRWLRGHPLVQLIAATTSGFTLSFDSWPLRLIAGAGLAIIAGITQGYAIIFIALVFCYDIAACMMSIRRSGALDDILTTPVEQQFVARAFMRVFATRSLVYIPAALVAAFWIGDAQRFQLSFVNVAMLVVILLPSQIFLIVAAGSYAGTRTNRAASQAGFTILLVVLLFIFAYGLSESAGQLLWGSPWRDAFTGRNAERNTLVFATVLNIASGIACYIAFATQLREDLISHIRPRFPLFKDAREHQLAHWP